MKITADTNVLVRAITGDDEKQSRVAQAQLANADMAAIAAPVLCELVWLGGETFVSFDKKAVKLMDAQGKSVRLLS